MKNKIIYRSGIRHHIPEYPYRIVVEKREGGEIVICHVSYYHNKEGDISHSIGVKKSDLERILKNIKK